MNPLLHATGHSQRIKMMLTCAVFGGAMCVTSAAVALADEIDEPSPVNRAPSDRSTPLMLRLPQSPTDSPSTSVNSPAQWADLSSPNAHAESIVIADAIDRSSFDFDPAWVGRSNASASVHVGPAPSAFIPESFRGAQLLIAQPALQKLHPSRLPPTGYFDESMTNKRIAVGPHDSW